MVSFRGSRENNSCKYYVPGLFTQVRVPAATYRGEETVGDAVTRKGVVIEGERSGRILRCKRADGRIVCVVG